MKVLTFARRIAHEEGFKPISNKVLDFLIWEQTGFPSFWQTSEPLKEFEEQLRQAFLEIREHNGEKEMP